MIDATFEWWDPLCHEKMKKGRHPHTVFFRGVLLVRLLGLHHGPRSEEEGCAAGRRAALTAIYASEADLATSLPGC